MTRDEYYELIERSATDGTFPSYREPTPEDKAEGRNDPHCLYRGSGGKKCVVGLLIPDEEYSPEMENQHVGVLLDKDPQRSRWFPEGVDRAEACALQRCHDGTVEGGWDPDAFLSKLRQIRQQFSPKPQEVTP